MTLASRASPAAVAPREHARAVLVRHAEHLLAYAVHRLARPVNPALLACRGRPRVITPTQPKVPGAKIRGRRKVLVDISWSGWGLGGHQGGAKVRDPA